MSCIEEPNQTITQEQQAALIIRGAKVEQVDPNTIIQVAEPILCFPPNGQAPAYNDIELDWTITDTTNSPVSGAVINFNGQSLTTNSSGQANSAPIQISFGDQAEIDMTITDTSGTPQSGLNVTLGGITKTTDSSGNVTFFVAANGVVS